MMYIQNLIFIYRIAGGSVMHRFSDLTSVIVLENSTLHFSKEKIRK